MARPKLPIVLNETPRSPLKPWEIHFGMWFHSEPKKPSKAAQLEAATRILNEGRSPGSEALSVTYNQLRGLRRRADWQELFARLEQGGIDAARVLFVNNLPALVELHQWAAQQAKLKGDYRAMAPLTTPALDRVLPKREGTGGLAEQNILIALTVKQASLIDSDRPIVEAEIIAEEES